MSFDEPEDRDQDEARQTEDQIPGQQIEGASIRDAPDQAVTQTPEDPAPHVIRISRLHPTSLLFEVISQARTFIIPAVIALFSAAQGSASGLIFAAVIFVPAFLTSVFRYFTLRYSIHSGELIVTQGLIFRRVRTVPVSRIQNIDSVQNVLHRLFNVAEIRVETASGTEAEAALRVLSTAKVKLLRSEVLAAQKTAPIVQQDESPKPADVPQPETLLDIPTSWLVRAGLASNRGMLIIGIIAGAYYTFGFDERVDVERVADWFPEGLGTMLTIVLSIVAVIIVFLMLRVFGIFWYVLRFHGYRLSRHGDNLRITCGLLTKVSATVPRKRIQFISIHRTLFMRWMGYASIRIETAGGAGKEGENAASTVSRRWFIPVVPEQHVNAMIEQLRPGLGWNPLQATWHGLAPRARRRLIRIAVIQCIVIAAIGLAIARPWGWIAGIALLPLMVWWAIRTTRATRYSRIHNGVAYRSGVFNRKLSLTFFEKIQALRLAQSPFDRRWKMATLSVDTAAAGPAGHSIKIRFLDEVFARGEFRELVQRSASHEPVYA